MGKSGSEQKSQSRARQEFLESILQICSLLQPMFVSSCFVLDWSEGEETEKYFLILSLRLRDTETNGLRPADVFVRFNRDGSAFFHQNLLSPFGISLHEHSFSYPTWREGFNRFIRVLLAQSRDEKYSAESREGVLLTLLGEIR